MEKIKSEFVVTRQFGQMLGYTVLSVEQNMIQTISMHWDYVIWYHLTLWWHKQPGVQDIAEFWLKAFFSFGSTIFVGLDHTLWCKNERNCPKREEKCLWYSWFANCLDYCTNVQHIFLLREILSWKTMQTDRQTGTCAHTHTHRHKLIYILK